MKTSTHLIVIISVNSVELQPIKLPCNKNQNFLIFVWWITNQVHAHGSKFQALQKTLAFSLISQIDFGIMETPVVVW